MNRDDVLVLWELNINDDEFMGVHEEPALKIVVERGDDLIPHVCVCDGGKSTQFAFSMDGLFDAYQMTRRVIQDRVQELCVRWYQEKWFPDLFVQYDYIALDLRNEFHKIFGKE